MVECLVCTRRLSKELQQKDKIIESLHTKLQQRPETPSSCHALSETTDQSDRTSLVSDEYRTNEDLELSSDLDGKEYQEERELEQPGQGSEHEGKVFFRTVQLSIIRGNWLVLPLTFHSPHLAHPPILHPHGFLKSSSSCPNMRCSAPVSLTSPPFAGMSVTDVFDLQKCPKTFLVLLLHVPHVSFSSSPFQRARLPLLLFPLWP